MSDEPVVITITDYDEARDVYRQKDLRQALYDAGEVVMADVLVNLHADEHRDRRRLENRLFRRDTFTLYERELFPPIIEETLPATSRSCGWMRRNDASRYAAASGTDAWPRLRRPPKRRRPSGVRRQTIPSVVA